MCKFDFESEHLIFCFGSDSNLTVVQGITALLHNCPRLTHLSLTGVQAFLREDLTRFCRDAPAEFTHPQRDVFCVFSGEGVQRLREYLMRLAMDEAQREGREVIDDSLLDGVDSPGTDTMSDDGTIDGNDQLMDPVLNPHRHGLPFANTPRSRPRPRSLHEMPSYHVDMPLVPFDQMQQMGPWTPGESFTPEGRAALAPPHLNLISSSNFEHHNGYDLRSRSPGRSLGYEIAAEYNERARSTSRTPSRRHTLESSSGIFGPPPVPMHGYGESSSRPLDLGHYGPDPRTGYFDVDDMRRFPGWSNANAFVPEHPRRHIPGAAFRNPGDVRVSNLRPEPGFSAFDANHEAIMSTIPGSRAGSRHPSRSNSPHVSRVNSRSRLANLIPRSYTSTPLSQGENAGRASRQSRSRELSRSRMEEEAHREAMLRALAEADAAQQLRPGISSMESDEQRELPPLPSEVMQPIPVTVLSADAASQPESVGIQGGPEQERDMDQDVAMTQ